MKFHSTEGGVKATSLSDAIVLGLAPDGGLYLPNRIPRLKQTFLRVLQEKSFQEIAEEVLPTFMPEIPTQRMNSIINSAFDFSIPLRDLGDNLYVLELFHGPTLSFKDFGARFLARSLEFFLEQKKEKANIVVATSGDTGSAVASGFLGMANIRVFVLYPKGRVSKLQEQQITTYGQNITALEVRGKFDDCQRMVKEALAIGKNKKGIRLSSANSINIGRLLPQSLYYIYAVSELLRRGIAVPPRFVVPSGNFGNLTAGILAKKMGAPIAGFIAATNANNVVPSYLKTGKFQARTSKETLSNAMDVGDPSNFARMRELYSGKRSSMAQDISGFSVSDKETVRTIKETYERYGYLADPHTAVGIAAAKKYKRQQRKKQEPLVVLATAHPAKFKTIVERAIGKKITLPPALIRAAQKKKRTIVVRPSIQEIMDIL